MMRTGDFNPHFFDYPGFYIYVQLAVSVVRFIFGAMGGQWHALKDVSALDFYALGPGRHRLSRYRHGVRWSISPGCDGARAMRCSRAGLMAVHAAARAGITFHPDRRPDDLLRDAHAPCCPCAAQRARASSAGSSWRGAAAGLAAGTKYNGAIALILPVLACLDDPSMRDPRGWRRASPRSARPRRHFSSSRPIRSSTCHRSSTATER